MSEEHYDEGLHHKEVYAHFGATYESANIFEYGLALAIMKLDYLTEWRKKSREEGRTNFDKSSYEAGFDVFMAKQHAQTLGNLITRVQNLAEMGPDLKAQILRAKERRDFLAHHFFRVRAFEFFKREGRDAMIAELVATRQLFDLADNALSDFIEPYQRKLGISKDWLAKEIPIFLKEKGIPDDLLES